MISGDCVFRTIFILVAVSPRFTLRRISPETSAYDFPYVSFTISSSVRCVTCLFFLRFRSLALLPVALLGPFDRSSFSAIFAATLSLRASLLLAWRSFVHWPSVPYLPSTGLVVMASACSCKPFLTSIDTFYYLDVVFLMFVIISLHFFSGRNAL